MGKYTNSERIDQLDLKIDLMGHMIEEVIAKLLTPEQIKEIQDKLIAMLRGEVK